MSLAQIIVISISLYVTSYGNFNVGPDPVSSSVAKDLPGISAFSHLKLNFGGIVLKTTTMLLAKVNVAFHKFGRAMPPENASLKSEILKLIFFSSIQSKLFLLSLF